MFRKKSRDDNGDDYDAESGMKTLFDYEADKKKKMEEGSAIDKLIVDQVLTDKSAEAKRGRRQVFVKAIFGEFMCTLLFYTPVFCTIAHATQAGWDPDTTTLVVSLVGGLQGTANCFTFSEISGAQFNSAVSFALWGTKKLSNRRFMTFVLVQCLASIMAMAIVSAIFHGNLESVYDAIAVVPADNNYPGKVFAEEFILTFMLVYVIFTVALQSADIEMKETYTMKEISERKGFTVYSTSPQSKMGFAPFSIGFTIFALSNVGGTSGGAFNPGRLLGPAIFSGKWTQIYIYWIAQFLGALSAAMMVTRGVDLIAGTGDPIFSGSDIRQSKSTELSAAKATSIESSTANPLREE